MPPRRIPDSLWRRMRQLNRGVVGRYGRLGPPAGMVLLLTTRGRRSGLERVTPLQYEEIDGVFYVGSARGARADWFRNLVADPHVRLQVGQRQVEAEAEPITDPRRIADFFELRLGRHPRMMRLLLRAEGLPAGFDRSDLEAFASGKAVVALRPGPAASAAGLQG